MKKLLIIFSLLLGTTSIASTTFPVQSKQLIATNTQKIKNQRLLGEAGATSCYRDCIDFCYFYPDWYLTSCLNANRNRCKLACTDPGDGGGDEGCIIRNNNRGCD